MASFCFAHSANDLGHRQDLAEHLLNVARKAEEFAAPFLAGKPGYYAGLWHDLGKFHPDFQAYLLACEQKRSAPRTDHKAAGVLLAKQYAQYLVPLLHGHHGGLRDQPELRTWLSHDQLIARGELALSRAKATMSNLEPQGSIPPPPFIGTDALEADLLMRMLFSSLVDADYLDAEAHFTPQRSAARGGETSLAELLRRFEADQARFPTRPDSAVDRVRRDVYEACLDAASQPPGMFRLTVPTGGGKTRSGMAFALRHALAQGLERVIVAVPYISITEQTAEVYRGIFGETAVLEHHSQAGADLDDEDYRPDSLWNRLAAENWDAPIIVTTTVQLFESLFSNRTSRARKLHRLAKSVVILDEAQALPAHLLEPILGGLAQLCRHYATTVVLSTATQPAFDVLPDFKALGAREIVPQPERYFEALRRVEYQWRTGSTVPMADIAAEMRSHVSALAILNTKKDALSLLDALGGEDVLHLSTLLCGKHRSTVIQEVRDRLEAGRPCLLVATQVVEAGVDLDFPFVARALGPWDSVIQAAGRCNREGRLASGRVLVFEPEGGGLPRSAAYQIGTNLTRIVLNDGFKDANDPAAARSYFTQLLSRLQRDLDRTDIQGARRHLDFRTVADRFRMIDDDTESVVVPYGSEGERATVAGILASLRSGRPDPQRRSKLRLLQPFTVAIYRRQLAGFAARGLVTPVVDGVWEWHGRYDPVRGLTPEGDPDRLLV